MPKVKSRSNKSKYTKSEWKKFMNSILDESIEYFKKLDKVRSNKLNHENNIRHRN